MPSLAETLQANKKKLLTRGPGGQLSEESPEGVQQLSQQAGLSAPPTTPLGAGLLGANPDQQKMMGTPAQKAAAISLASKPQDNLQTALRQQQVRTQATGAEAGKIEKSQTLKDLGAMGDRVSDFINSQRAKLAAATPVQVKAATEFQGKDVTSLQPLLEQLRADPTNQQLMLEVNKALGYDINTQLDPSQVEELYQDATSAVSSGGAGVVSDSMTVADLVNDPNFQYDEQQLSSLLGVPLTEVAGMSIADIQNKIAEIEQQEFSTAEQLEQKAQSGVLGQAERGLARQQAREASAVGTRASEADFQHLEDQIARADEVQFGGKAYNIEDLLRDDTISGIISDYMNSGLDSKIRQDIDSKEPALSEFIKKNEKLLTDAATQLRAGTEEFKQTQEANKELANVGGIKLPDALMSAILPGWGELSAQKHSIYESPVLAQLDSLRAHPEQGDAAVAAQALATQAQQDPNFAVELAGLNQSEVSKLQLGVPGGAFDQYLAAKEQNQKIQALPPGKSDQAAKFLTGNPKLGAKEAEESYKDSRASSALGLIEEDSKWGILDPTGSGNINWDSVGSYLKSGSAVPSLKDAAAGKVATASPVQLPKPDLLNNPEAGDVLSKLRDAAADGFISRGDLDNPELTLDNLSWMIKQPGIKVDKAALEDRKNKLATPATQERLAEITAPSVPIGDQLNALFDMYSGDKTRINTAQVKAALDAKTAEMVKFLTTANTVSGVLSANKFGRDYSKNLEALRRIDPARASEVEEYKAGHTKHLSTPIQNQNRETDTYSQQDLQKLAEENEKKRNTYG